MNKTKDQASWVLSHGLYRENKMYIGFEWSVGNLVIAPNTKTLKKGVCAAQFLRMIIQDGDQQTATPRRNP